MDQVGFEEQVPQEAEAGDYAGEPLVRRLDIQDVHFQQVSRLGPLHIYRPGQRVDHIQVYIPKNLFAISKI